MAKIDSGLGWKVNDAFYTSTTSDVLASFAGYEAHKTSAGAAIIAGFYDGTAGNTADFAVISTDKNFAEFEQTSGDTVYIGGRYIGNYTKNNLTWHVYAKSGGLQTGSSLVSNARQITTPTLTTFYEDLTAEEIVELFYTATGIEETAPKLATTGYVKEFVEGVEAETATRVNANKNNIGTLSSLTTTAKTDAVSAINELNSAKQPKTMSAAITVDGTEETTVEGALSAINTLAAGNKTNKQDKNLSSAITVNGAAQTTVENALGAINNYCDVQESKISEIYAATGLYGNDVYGVQVDFENYIYTRLAGAVGKTAGTDFNVAPRSGMKRCNLADNGTVNAYYGDNGYIEDGSNGQVMVEIPKFYYRVVPLKLDPIGDTLGGYHMRKANYYISVTKYEGFKTHPLFVKPDGTERDKAYASAYEGSLYDVSASAYILDDAQVADFTATTGDKLCSIANAKPVSGLTQNLTRANSEILATNRGTGWHCMDIKAASAVQLLFMIEYASLNSQNVIGKGVVDKSDDDSTNMAVITGGTSSLGNASGTASGASGLVSVSYRGVENFYGNIWKFIEGLIIWGDGTLRSGQPYICDDYSFTEDTKTGYTGAKFTVSNTSNFISAFGYDPDFDWLFLPSECVGADSNYPIGDYSWAISNLNGYRLSLLGACWYIGGRAGAFSWFLSSGAGTRDRDVGARLLYIP